MRSWRDKWESKLSETNLTRRINGLPRWARQYIHDIETKCDPAGDIRTIAELRDTIRCLEKELKELRRTS
jgi:hypothetical protein